MVCPAHERSAAAEAPMVCPAHERTRAIVSLPSHGAKCWNCEHKKRSCEGGPQMIRTRSHGSSRSLHTWRNWSAHLPPASARAMPV
jgi:hypothetical protein